MNKLLVFALLCSLTLSLHLQQNQPLPDNPQIVGGWTTGDANNPDPNIDKFIKTQFPQLANAKLIKTETQVVAGINYKYSYLLNNVTWRVVVWDQSWTQTRQVTEIEKVEQKINADGKNVQVTTNTRIETQNFAQLARSYFKQ